jgi:hypothetical protein
MPQAKPQDGNTTQAAKFRKAAREAEADQDEEAFKRRLKQIAKAPAPKPEKK